MKLLLRTDEYYGGSTNVVVTYVDDSLDLTQSDGGTSVVAIEPNVTLFTYSLENETNSNVVDIREKYDESFAEESNPDFFPKQLSSLEYVYDDVNGVFNEHPNLVSSEQDEGDYTRTITYSNGDVFTVSRDTGEISKVDEE
tara:strand:+ start:121 stop:543 length:423 start_codon:yes stop_codon:yes gene_type:complete